MPFKTVEQFRQAPLMVRAFVLYLLASLAIVLGSYAWVDSHIDTSRELLEFVMALGQTLPSPLFAMAMALGYLLDPKPRYLRFAAGFLWMGAISGGLMHFVGRNSLSVFIAPAGIALFWTIALERVVRHQETEKAA